MYKEIVDLTHTLDDTIPTWDGECGFQIETKLDYKQCTSTPQFKVQGLTMNAGMGTHLDSPAHCFPNGVDIASLSLKELIKPLYVLDISAKADANYGISIEDIINFENKFGKIEPESFFIGYTGWSKHWHEPALYRNSTGNGFMNFPHFKPEAVELLLQRNIAGLGIDTLSPDIYTPDNTLPAHNLMLSRNKYIVENLANCDKLPPKGATIVIAPIKIGNGTEAPVRAFAFLP